MTKIYSYNYIFTRLENDIVETPNIIHYSKPYYTLIYYDDNNKEIYKVGIGDKIININEAIVNNDIEYYKYLTIEKLTKENLNINIIAFKKLLNIIEDTDDDNYIYCLRIKIKKLPTYIIKDNMNEIIKTITTNNILVYYFNDFIYILSLILYIHSELKTITFKYLNKYLTHYKDVYDYISIVYEFNNIIIENELMLSNERMNKDIINSIKRNSNLLYIKL